MATPTPDETILGLLAAHARHGYQLLDCFRDPSQLGEVWNLSTSQLYAVLKRLSERGCIIGHDVASIDTPTRTEYKLTEVGFARLQTWLHEPYPSASIRSVRVEFLSRLYIARLLNVPTIAIVRQQKAACSRQRLELSAQRDQVGPGVGYLALDLVIEQLDAVLQWIDRCELVPKVMGDDEI
jgi:DNA-binding PadR family transcriptional regulator